MPPTVKQTNRREPVLLTQSLVAGLNALQGFTLGIPTWAHVTIVVLTVMLGATISRQQVTPTGATQ